ncbi:hypothetical protein TNCV_184991 [Trichonephila clavipes]|nr:hypothetical protein TNCV_184991 [Trichonephila clavipes]
MGPKSCGLSHERRGLENIYFPPLQLHAEIVEVEIGGVAIYRLFGEFRRAKSYCHLVVPARSSSQSSRHCWRSLLPHASALIQRDFGCVLGIQQTKQLPHVAKVDLVWQLGV